MNSIGAAVALLRVFFGIVFVANGLPKLIGGSWSTNLGYLIDTNAALAAVRSSIAEHPIGPYREFVQSVIVPNWPTFVLLLGAFELVVGTLLILGLLTRAAAIAGLLFGLNLQVLALSGGQWLFAQAVLWVPLLAIALADAGRWYALDGRLERLRQRREPKGGG